MLTVRIRSTRSSFCIALLLVLFGCASKPPRAVDSYTVKSGDTLYSIAWRHGVDYRELARWNGIGRDYAIRPGQVLRFQAKASRAATDKISQPRSAAAANGVVRSTLPPMQWQWPTRATTATLTARPNGGQGLVIGGEAGQEIRAAAAGRVVYTGTGLLGYGQLVIIKHNEVYLSAYGHAQTVSVHERDSVQAGQAIATMGTGPTGKPMLYFEIRVNGQPVDPTAMLAR